MSKSAYNSAVSNMKRKTEKNFTVGKLKEDIRKQFEERIKELRFQNINARRNICIKTLNEELGKIKDNIKQRSDIAELMIDTDEVDDVFKEIEAEMSAFRNNSLIDRLIRQEEEETNSIIDNLFSCKVCDNFSPNNAVVCNNCVITYFNS